MKNDEYLELVEAIVRCLHDAHRGRYGEVPSWKFCRDRDCKNVQKIIRRNEEKIR